MNTWSFILDKSKENMQVILVVVINNYGSSPGRKGFKMLVSEDGSVIGSVGGGSMEQRMVKHAKRMISEGSNKVIIKHQEHHSNTDSDNSGMICSGSQAIAFFPSTVELLHEAEAIVQFQNEKGIGLIMFSPSGISLQRGKKQDERFQGRILSDDQWELTEQLGMPDTLYVFGAGHVSLALCRVFSMLDFKIELFDNRNGLNTFDDNNYVSKKAIVDFDDVGRLVHDGRNSYVVIMSYSHKYDESLLRQLLKKKVRYLGMMGSANKVKTIKANLIARGISEEELSTVLAPIGLSINSETPLEIAISVAAQIIGVRNG